MRPESLLNDREPFSTTISSILIVDDSIEDSIAITRLLRQNQSSSLRVTTAPNMLDALREFRHERPDCVLIDHRLADGEGIELLHMLSEITAPLPAPVIYLASEDSPRLAVRALKAGALDYLAKSWLDADSLKSAIDRAVEKVALARSRYQRQRATEDKNRDLQKSVITLQQSEKVKEQITGLAPTFLYIYDLLEDQLVYSNPTMQNTLGYSDADMREMSRGGIRRLVHPDDVAAYEGHIAGLSRLGDGEVSETELRVQHQAGNLIWLRLRETVFLRDKHNTVWQVIGSAEDVSAQKASRESLVERTHGLELELNHLRTVWDQGLVGIAIAFKNRPNHIKLNSVLANLLEMKEETDLGAFSRVFGFTFASSPVGKALARGVPTRNVERAIHRGDGSLVRVLETVQPLTDEDGIVSGCIAYYVPATDNEVTAVAPEERELVWHSRLAQLQSRLDLTEAQKNRAEEQIRENAQNAEEYRTVVEQLEQVVSRLRFDLDSNAEAFLHADELLSDATGKVAEAELRLAESEKRWQDSVAGLVDDEENKNSLTAKILQLQGEAESVKKELDSLRAQLTALEQGRRDAEEALTRKQEHLEATLAALEIAGARVADAERTLQVHAAASDELTNQIENLKVLVQEGEKEKARAALLEEQLESVRADLVQIEKERDTNSASLKALEAQLQKLIDDQENSRADLANHEDQTQALRLQLEVLNERVSQADEEKGRLATREKELSVELARTQSELTSASEAVASQTQELTELRITIDEAEARWKGADEELSSLRKVVTTSEAEQKDQLEKVGRLESLIVDLEASRAEAERERDTLQKDGQERVGLLEAQVVDLETSLAEAEHERDALKDADGSSLARANQAEAKVFGLEAVISRLTGDLETASQNLEKEKLSLANLKVQNETLKASETKAAENVRELAADLAESNERSKRLEELAISRGDSLVELGKVVDRSSEMLAEARAKRDESEKHILALDDQVRSLQTKLHSAEESWRKSEAEFNAKSREAGQLAVALKAREDELVSLNEAYQALEIQKAEADEKLADWHRSAPESAKKLQEATEELAKARREIATLSGAQTRLEKEVQEASAARDALSQKFETVTSELESLKVDHQKVVAELAAVSQREKIATEKAAKLEAEAQQLRTDLADARTKLEQSQREVQALDAQLRQRTAELEARIAEIEQLKTALARSEADRKDAQDRFIASENKLLHTQQDLRAAEEKYRSLASNVPQVIFTTNTLGMIEFANERWERYVGTPMDVSRENQWKDVIYKDDLDTFTHTWMSGIKDGTAFSIQFRLKRNDGHFRWHEMHNSPDMENGRMIRWYGTINEIHEQVVSREAARQARLRYGALLDGTSESVLFLSPNGNVLGASKSSLNLLRQGGEGVVGQYLWETKWWPKAESGRLEDAVRKAAAGEKVEVETMRVDSDGQHRRVALTINPIHDENKQVAMLVPYFKDI